MASAYAVLYNQDGWFLIAKKRKKGYYFGDGKTGDVYSAGQDIKNGPGLYALPGGGTEGQAVDVAAAREFSEETGLALPSYSKKEIKNFNIPKVGAWGAAYFCAANGEDVISTSSKIHSTSMPNSVKIINEIIKNKWKINEYNKVIEFTEKNKISPWPHDNELESVGCWNVKKPENWKTITSWKTAGNGTDWYYYTLEHLRNNILQVPQ
ncbi:NUDIX hydrolase [Burkholderia plantarii]|uniref:NUDIX hydrolase n=1 Tax=Burkholderia plantarii TaxID=41899 RepID=UPI000706ECD1|nr:NUDIX hydrolase [Burkholderia plantarii]ALK30254.1 NUDIX hydrolase [Burkholderia plantarii]GLZ18364.1 hypothetical protein Bpla01_18940 [Burkholderia plantarii]